ncbi:GNAT family N-acetyltransferase [Microbacterium hominis]|uniref:GNAT family N-acetyltransferase n=1 Tax=Microbacterium hominis TaxID=162426 RepID=A0A7D4QBU9_9MICO|nr:GNAT family N-acetyltransferase [Microbacterium hominis]QKJ18857.1 GNAT family N-acetyltransferase [Microbacterium hominis]
MDEVTIRRASSADARALAVLKRAWSAISSSAADSSAADSSAADPPGAGAAGDVADEFAEDLAAWMHDRAGDVVAVIAERGTRPVGMGWLVAFERVPDVHARARRVGDLQSVFVVAEERGRGVGTAIVSALCAAADERGIPRLTVSSSVRAVTLYERAGFQRRDDVLERRMPGP